MLIHDAEIIRAIPDNRTGERVPDIEYCEGFHDFGNMGISVICAYDYDTERYHVFMEDNLAEFETLCEAHDVLVGYNSKNFDNKLYRANGIAIPDDKTLDLLVELREASKRSGRKGPGLSLDNVIQANFNWSKDVPGALIPIMWQQGKYATVINHCLDDIKMTKQLTDRILDLKWIIDPREPDMVLRF